MKRIVVFLLLFCSLTSYAMNGALINSHEGMCENWLLKNMVLWYANEAEANLTLIKGQSDIEEFKKIYELIKGYKGEIDPSRTMHYDMKELKILAALSVLQISDCSPFAALEARLAFFPILQNFLNERSSSSHDEQHHEYLEEKDFQENLQQIGTLYNDIPNLFQYAYEQSWQDYVKKHPLRTNNGLSPRCAYKNYNEFYCETIRVLEEILNFVKSLLRDPDLESTEHSLVLNFPADPENQSMNLFLMFLYNRECMYKECKSRTQKRCNKKNEERQRTPFLELNVYADDGQKTERLFFQ